MSPTHLDLFSGIGGFALAARRAGFRTIGFSEIEPYASAVLKKHWPDIPNLGDIKSISIEMLFENGIIGGCDDNALIAKKEKLPMVDEPIVFRVEQKGRLNGDKKIGSAIEKLSAHGARKRNWKSSRITAASVCVAENHKENFSRSTTNSTTETQSGKNINPKLGSSQSKGDCHATIKSSATTATTQKPISEYVLTKKKKRQRHIDILTAGFPCQPYSCAGQQRGSDDDRALWPEIIRILTALASVGELPTWVLGENVTGIISMELDRCITDLENLGYEVQPIIIPACAVGAWHRRDRVWIIAHNRKIRGERFVQKKICRQSGFQRCEDVGRIAHEFPRPDLYSPTLCGGVNGIREELGAYGNAIVPQIAEIILKEIHQISYS